MRIRPVHSLVAPSMAVLVLSAACTGPFQTTPPSAAPTLTSPQQRPTPSEESPPTATDSPASVGTTEAPPASGQQLALRPGETAHLAFFDVTFQRFAYGEDGVSAGWRVEVCYRRPHPDQNPDNSTRVSADPWSVQVLDAEGPNGRPMWLAINEFPRDNEWSPPFPTTQLKLGTCQSGWLGVQHGNPDLQFLAVRYAPADFDDVVTWDTSA